MWFEQKPKHDFKIKVWIKIQRLKLLITDNIDIKYEITLSFKIIFLVSIINLLKLK